MLPTRSTPDLEIRVHCSVSPILCGVALDVLGTSALITRREQALSARGERMPLLPDKLGALAANLQGFDAAEIPYALISGLAVGLRTGVPRATLGVDFAIPTNVDRSALIRALADRGLRLTGEHAHSLDFIHESGEPVQLAFDPEFDAMIARAGRLDAGRLAIVVVTTEDLLTMKRRAASDPARRRSKALRDEADIALLEGDVPGDNEGW